MSLRHVLQCFALLTCCSVYGQVPQKIIDNGPDGGKLVFAILGDGYSADEQKKFVTDVDSLVIDGLLGNDFYKANQTAFNVYRVDLVSNASGVSTPTGAKDTALQVIYSGDWNQCWLSESAGTDDRINAALRILPKYDYVLVIANEPNYGGCARGSRLYVTSGDTWDVLAHEYGHGIGNLYDEYSVDEAGPYSGSVLNNRNCSTLTDKSRIIWRTLIKEGTVLPTVFDTTNMDANTFVGAFEGCGTHTTHIYRPVNECRMNTNHPNFCPVCSALMQNAVAPYLATGTVTSHASSVPISRPVYSEASFRLASFVPAQSPGTPPGNAPNPDSPNPSSYLNVVMRLKRDGTSTIIKASQVEGQMIRRQQASSQFLYALSAGKTTVATEFLPENPFVVRGFADPAHGKQEHFSTADEVTVVLKVPQSQAKALQAGKLSLQILSLKDAPEIPQLDNAVLEKLKASSSVKTEINVQPKALGAALRAEQKRSDAAIK